MAAQWHEEEEEHEEGVTYVDVESLQLSSQQPLQEAQRSACPRCGKRQASYCVDCVVPLVAGVPRLRLPVQVDILQHGESNAKATGAHAALLAPEDVRVIRHVDGSSHHRRQAPQDLPLQDYDPQDTVILFPQGEDTPCVGAPDCPRFRRALVLEGSWQKARALIATHPRLQGLRCVKLAGKLRTIYWRRGAASFRGAVDEGVCTIECVFHLCRALDPGAPPHRYDDLLWLFTHQRSLVAKHAAPMTSYFLNRIEEQRLGAKGAPQQGAPHDGSASDPPAAAAVGGKRPRAPSTDDDAGPQGDGAGAGLAERQQAQGVSRAAARREREQSRLELQRAFAEQQQKQRAGERQQADGVGERGHTAEDDKEEEGA